MARPMTPPPGRRPERFLLGAAAFLGGMKTKEFGEEAGPGPMGDDMPKPSVCPRCAVAVPPGTAHCPSCQRPLGRRRPVWGLVAAAVVGLAAGALALMGWLGAAGDGTDWAAKVTVSPGGIRLSADGRGTDVFGLLDNANPVPVDVTVRVVARDVAGDTIAREVAGRYRGVEPGRTLPIRHFIDSTPLETVEFEVIEARPSGR
jgi:hypothetical protein